MKNYEIYDEFGVDFDYSYLDDVITATLKHESAEGSFLSVIFIDDEEMHKMNKETRGIDRTTDVLSFALEDNDNIKGEIRVLGDIFISIPKMKAQAKEYGHSELREECFLLVHGLLHLLGYDHTKSLEDEKIMFGKQDIILSKAGIERWKKNY